MQMLFLAERHEGFIIMGFMQVYVDPCTKMVNLFLFINTISPRSCVWELVNKPVCDEDRMLI